MCIQRDVGHSTMMSWYTINYKMVAILSQSLCCFHRPMVRTQGVLGQRLGQAQKRYCDLPTMHCFQWVFTDGFVGLFVGCLITEVSFVTKDPHDHLYKYPLVSNALWEGHNIFSGPSHYDIISPPFILLLPYLSQKST